MPGNVRNRREGYLSAELERFGAEGPLKHGGKWLSSDGLNLNPDLEAFQKTESDGKYSDHAPPGFRSNIHI